MEIPVVIETVGGNGYRVSGTSPFSFSAEGPTREDAVRNAQEVVARRVAQGLEVTTIQVQPAPAPWARYAGSLRDDPLLEAFRAAVEEYRAMRDAEEDDVP